MEMFGLQTLSMTLGAAFVLFGVAVRKSREDGDSFDFLLFWRQNTNRLMLLIFGLMVVSLLMFLDPVGLEAIASQFSIAIQIGSPAIVGAALGGLVLIVKKNTKPGEQITKEDV